MRRGAATPSPTGAKDQTVILLHGIARGAGSMQKMARVLRGDGYNTINIDYPSRKQSIGALADYVHHAIGGDRRTDGGVFHLVTHSMGGLVARAYITRYRPQGIGRVVMLGPPSQGSEIADLLADLTLYHRIFGPAGAQLTTRRDEETMSLMGAVDFSLGIIAGNRAIDPLGWLLLPRPNDGRVSVTNTHVPEEADHIVLPVAHSFLPFSDRAVRNTCHFLRHGHFQTADRR